MPQVHGNIEGVRKSLLNEMVSLYDTVIEPDSFIPQQLLSALCGYSALLNREIAVYITRDGEIADLLIGCSDHIDLPDLRLRRTALRLSMIRCVHTHPSASGALSAVDIAALKSMRFDAMCAVGVAADGHPTSVQCGFLNPDEEGSAVMTDLLSAVHIPHREWLDRIEDTDRRYLAQSADNTARKERAALVGIESEASLDELEELAKTAGAECVLRVLQKRSKPDSGYCVGRGKAEEIALAAQAADVDLVIFDEELTSAVQKNLEEILRVKVIDRTALILDIFAARASTREGKLQVEMAQLRYRSTHLIGQGLVLSRLAGGIGTRGPGESKLEMNRRRIRERMTDLEHELEQIRKQRELRRQSREKNRVPVAALVGYTNVGKSTLFNRLTDAGVYVENQLFATLDSVSRPITLPHGGKIMLVDTVGFIRKLPHELIKAFRSTLEEAALADILVIVCDATDPQLCEHYQTVLEVLQGLQAGDKPILLLMNKSDAAQPPADGLPRSLCISALNGTGIDEMLLALEQMADHETQEARMLIPFDKYALLARVHQLGSVLSQEHGDHGVTVTCRMEKERIRELCREGAKLLSGN